MYRFAESQARVGTGEAAWPMGWSGEAWNADGTERGEGRGGGGCELRSPIPLPGARFVIEAPPPFSAVCRVLLRPPPPSPPALGHVRPAQPGADRAARTAHSAARHCACLVPRAPLHQRSKQKHNSSKMGACASQPEDPERGTLHTRRSSA